MKHDFVHNWNRGWLLHDYYLDFSLQFRRSEDPEEAKPLLEGVHRVLATMMWINYYQYILVNEGREEEEEEEEDEDEDEYMEDDDNDDDSDDMEEDEDEEED